VLGHGGHFRHDRLACPLDAEDLCKLLEVLRAGFADAKHGVAEPRHTERAELLVKEFDAQLACEKRDVLDDGQTHTPLLVFRKLHDGWEERLREQVDTNDVVDLLELGDDVEADVGKVVLEHLEEHGQEVLCGLALAQDGCQTTNLVAEGGADVL